MFYDPHYFSEKETHDRTGGTLLQLLTGMVADPIMENPLEKFKSYVL